MKQSLKLIEGTILEAASTIVASDRKALSRALHACPELSGNQKVPSLGRAISVLAQALSSVGFTLDMVSGDLLLGPRGSRHLSYRRTVPAGADAFDELPQIENSRINFTWEDLTYPADSSQRSYEVIAYVT